MTTELVDPPEQCPKCQNKASPEPHTCPAREWKFEDYDFKCRCCEQCQTHCCMDI